MSHQHHTTVELSNCRIKLRSDLEFNLQEYRGQTCYVIEDPINARVFRIGLAEYHFVARLDGTYTVANAIANNAATLGDKAITEADALTLAKWLVDTNLATTEISRSASRLVEQGNESREKHAAAQFNPVTPKFELGNPDRWLASLNRVAGWLFSIPAFIVWLAVISVGVYHVLSRWDLASGNALTVLDQGNWIWLSCIGFGLKLLHETAHGLACKRLGGTVRQCGIVLILLIPLPYVDVTSTWRFPSKWHRIFVALAGMYAELFVAAIGAIVWSMTDLGILHQQAFNVMLAGSVSTLLFNLNPLMRFDGYYVLADWLELPNLATHGQQLLRWFGQKYGLGLDAKKPEWPESSEITIASYAVLALLWRVLICAALVIAAESMLFGMGVILAGIAVLYWVIIPILKLLKFVFVGERGQAKPSVLRFTTLVALTGMIGWSVWTQVPWYARLSAPAIVQYANLHEIRVPVSGFVKYVYVSPDQHVEKGDFLAQLKNPELAVEVKQLEMQITTADLRARQYKREQNIPAYQVETENLRALRNRLKLRQEQLSSLTIVASHSGQILADDLSKWEGNFLSAGSLFCGIGSSKGCEVHALISQQDAKHFQAKVNKPVDIHVWGSGNFDLQGTLTGVTPKASRQISYAPLSSTYGGPLAVKYRPPGHHTDEEDSFELVKPRILAKVAFPKRLAKKFKAGQTGFVSIRTSRGSVGDVISESTRHWLETLRQQQVWR